MGVKGLMRTCSLRVGTKMTRQMFTATLNFRAEEGLGVKEITPVGGGGGGGGGDRKIGKKKARGGMMPRPFPSILNRSQTKRPGEESRDCFGYSLSPTRRLHCKLKKQLVTVSSLI